MPKGKQPQTLQLHSYKIDTSHLENKMEELQLLKQQLQRSLDRQIQKQSQDSQKINTLTVENSQMKKENDRLKKKVEEQNKNISQLEEKIKELNNNNRQYKQELRIVEGQKKAIEKQVADLLIQRELSARKQQQKNRTKINQIQESIEASDQQSIESSLSSSSSINSSSKKVKRLKRQSSPVVQGRGARSSAQVQEKYKMENQISEREEDSSLSAQELYLQMIRLLYKQLLKIELKARDLLKLPIIASFAKVPRPTRNDLDKLLSSYPFQIKEHQRLSLIHDFIVKEFAHQDRKFTGEDIINQIAAAVEDIEYEQDISLQSGVSSAYLTESDAFSNHLAVSSGFNRYTKPITNVIQVQGDDLNSTRRQKNSKNIYGDNYGRT